MTQKALKIHDAPIAYKKGEIVTKHSRPITGKGQISPRFNVYDSRYV